MIDTRAEFDGLFWGLYAWVTVGVTAAVFALVVVALVRRRAPGSRSENAPLELGYAVVLLGIAAFLFFRTFETEARVDELSDRPALTIRVRAFQWQWRFLYPGGVATVGTRSRPAELVVPAGRTIRFELTAREVIHAFYVPALRFKRDAFPGHVNRFDLVFPRPGRYLGTCAEFCGLRHTDMRFVVRALPAAEFRAWLEDRG